MANTRCFIYAALVVVAIVLVAAGWPRLRERFGGTGLDGVPYHPCTADPALHAGCRGLTTGAMPAIDNEPVGGWLCPGRLGVPPPVVSGLMDASRAL